MKIIVNGKKETVESIFLTEVLKELGLDVNFAAVALNWKSIPKTELEKTALREGDQIEILVPQSGG